MKLNKKQRNGVIIVVIFAIIITSIGFIQFTGFMPYMGDGGGGEPPINYDSLPSKPILYDIQPDPDPDVSVNLDWSTSTDVWYYNVYRRIGGIEQKIKTGEPSNSFIDATTKENQKYYYRIEAVNNIGKVQSNEESVTINVQGDPIPDPLFDDDPPVAPVLNMIAGPSDTGEIDISWSSVSDADDYGVYRSNDGTSYDILVERTTSTNYDDTITESGTYYYKLRAGNEGGTSAFSNVKSVIVTIPGVPDVPEAYYPTYEIIDSGIEIVVSWSEVTCDSYNLYRAIINDTGSTGFVLIEEGLTSTSYSVVLTEIGSYRYKISAVNDLGESEQSNSAVINITEEGAEEPLDDDYIWLYVLLGVLCVAVVPVVILTRKKKKKSQMSLRMRL